MKTKLIVFVILLVFIFTAINSYAFCVYNNTDTKIGVEEISGGKFLKNFDEEIYPGDKKCCNWKNKDCNVEGRRDSLVEFHVETVIEVPYPGVKPQFICQVKVKAGGALVVTGKKGNYRCNVYGY